MNKDLLNTIQAELRATMNGVASRAIRESGMGYRLVYGTELPRLRELAAGYAPDRRLAQSLWQEDVRECRILAILLYPHEEFDEATADLWIEGIRTEQAELAQLLAMEQLCVQAYASEQSFRWMADERPVYQLCGFLTITRLLMRGETLAPDAADELLDQAAATLPTDYLPLRKAAQNALLRYGQQSAAAQRRVEQLLAGTPR